MGEAVCEALDILEKRKQEYQNTGVDYYQPWLVLMTDGMPTDDINEAVNRVVSMVNQKKLSVFPIGIGHDADMDILSQFSPARPPLRLQGLKFREFFEWLSASVQRVSASTPGEEVPLDLEGIKGWGYLVTMGSDWSNMSLSRWKGTVVSTAGRGHVAKGLPCQDVSGVSLEDDVAIIVVSDGAGSARYSEQGAAGAVEVATQVLRETAPWSGPEDVKERILAACRAEMIKRAKELKCSIAELAATLAFVAVAGDITIAGNLGDGIVAAFEATDQKS